VTTRPDRATGLGRGLGALIPQRASAGSGVTEIPLARIEANPRQPRQRFADAEMESLAASIREHGVIQPVLVTETINGYQLIAGERRVRAARLAGLERIPAVIRQLADVNQLELALVENVQRADLDPIETARAYQQERLAARVGRARPTIANTLRLLDLDLVVQDAIAAGSISEGHGRALGALPTEHQRRILTVVIDQALSVRQTEELARRIREPQPAGRPADEEPADPDRSRVEDDLRRALGTKVSLSRTSRGGRIVIEYYSDEELGRLYERLVGGSA